jgi:hypothetical protein
MNKFEYREPEFKVVYTAQDILTASETPAETLGGTSNNWNTASHNGGGITFGA